MEWRRSDTRLARGVVPAAGSSVRMPQTRSTNYAVRRACPSTLRRPRSLVERTDPGRAKSALQVNARRTTMPRMRTERISHLVDAQFCSVFDWYSTAGQQRIRAERATNTSAPKRAARAPRERTARGRRTRETCPSRRPCRLRSASRWRTQSPRTSPSPKPGISQLPQSLDKRTAQSGLRREPDGPVADWFSEAMPNGAHAIQLCQGSQR